ncbi:hypothetical protein B0H14DRAFT_3765153 [Mycena olivaceomarginata]|nr:hypothetical protein B0H14DRAFT_3653272 [Mycena olivaceomarginata]KAJ7807146.1 hypothetical protein B0H14DRAFT_3765153 [Mycena olivaceomarginata]
MAGPSPHLYFLASTFLLLTRCSVFGSATIDRRSGITYAGECNATDPSPGQMCGNWGTDQPQGAAAGQQCDLFYTATAGDSCAGISSLMRMSSSDFWEWNQQGLNQSLGCPVNVGSVYCLHSSMTPVCSDPVLVTPGMTCDDFGNRTKAGYSFLQLNQQINFQLSETNTTDNCNTALGQYNNTLIPFDEKGAETDLATDIAKLTTQIDVLKRRIDNGRPEKAEQ